MNKINKLRGFECFACAQKFAPSCQPSEVPVFTGEVCLAKLDMGGN